MFRFGPVTPPVVRRAGSTRRERPRSWAESDSRATSQPDPADTEIAESGDSRVATQTANSGIVSQSAIQTNNKPNTNGVLTAAVVNGVSDKNKVEQKSIAAKSVKVAAAACNNSKQILSKFAPKQIKKMLSQKPDIIGSNSVTAKAECDECGSTDGSSNAGQTRHPPPPTTQTATTLTQSTPASSENNQAKSIKANAKSKKFPLKKEVGSLEKSDKPQYLKLTMEEMQELALRQQEQQGGRSEMKSKKPALKNEGSSLRKGKIFFKFKNTDDMMIGRVCCVSWAGSTLCPSRGRLAMKNASETRPSKLNYTKSSFQGIVKK